MSDEKKNIITEELPAGGLTQEAFEEPSRKKAKKKEVSKKEDNPDEEASTEDTEEQ